jgi:hypothetical protein
MPFNNIIIGINKARGDITQPKITPTIKTAIPLINALAVPQKISPRTISSIPTGVRRMASYIPLVTILVYAPNVDSNAAAYIDDEAIIPGTIYST